MQPYGVHDNPYSVLDVADIVYVNPVNTGFSRIIKKQQGDKKDTDESNRQQGASRGVVQEEAALLPSSRADSRHSSVSMRISAISAIGYAPSSTARTAGIRPSSSSVRVTVQHVLQVWPTAYKRSTGYSSTASYYSLPPIWASTRAASTAGPSPCPIWLPHHGITRPWELTCSSAT